MNTTRLPGRPCCNSVGPWLPPPSNRLEPSQEECRLLGCRAPMHEYSLIILAWSQGSSFIAHIPPCPHRGERTWLFQVVPEQLYRNPGVTDADAKMNADHRRIRAVILGAELTGKSALVDKVSPCPATNYSFTQRSCICGVTLPNTPTDIDSICMASSLEATTLLPKALTPKTSPLMAQSTLSSSSRQSPLVRTCCARQVTRLFSYTQ